MEALYRTFVAACSRRMGIRSIVTGDINVDLISPGLSDRDAEIVGSLAELGLDNMSKHYRLSLHHKDSFTWKQVRNGELLTSRCDALL